MPKIEPFTDSGSEGTLGYMFKCPGCKMYHEVYVRPAKNGLGASWQFNGDLEKPTFSPSLLVKGYSEKLGRDYVCHSFIVDGQIQFLGDCTHELAGQTVPLPEVED